MQPLWATVHDRNGISLRAHLVTVGISHCHHRSLRFDRCHDGGTTFWGLVAYQEGGAWEMPLLHLVQCKESSRWYSHPDSSQLTCWWLSSMQTRSIFGQFRGRTFPEMYGASCCGQSLLSCSLSMGCLFGQARALAKVRTRDGVVPNILARLLMFLRIFMPLRLIAGQNPSACNFLFDSCGPSIRLSSDGLPSWLLPTVLKVGYASIACKV